MYSITAALNNNVSNTGNLLRVDFRCSHHINKQNDKYVSKSMLISSTIVIISLSICISNHHVYPKDIQFLLFEI